MFQISTTGRSYLHILCLKNFKSYFIYWELWLKDVLSKPGLCIIPFQHHIYNSHADSNKYYCINVIKIYISV